MRLATFYVDEDDQQDDAADHRAEDERVRPAHRAAAVRLEPVGDADQDRDQAHAEEQVAPPVHLRVLTDADVVQHVVRPDGAEHADWGRDEEDKVPVHRGEHAAEDQSDERARDRCDRVQPERGAALVGRERVGEDRGRVGEQERAADALHHPPDDQPQRAGHPVHPRHGQEDRSDGEHREPEVVHPHPAEHVAQAAERHHKHRRDHHEAHEHPQQVARITRTERVQPDALEHGGQRDQHDRLVDRRHQHAERGV
jgi:hypothetical protein